MTVAHTNPYKTLIICTWLGSWPTFLPFFSRTASRNQKISWLIITDQSKPSYLPDNIFHQEYSLNDLNSLFSKKLGFPVQISKSRKLCDFKPAYGLIFNEFLRKYDYWGYCDLDLIFGDLETALSQPIGKGTDIISFYKDFLSGPLCIYKNTDRIKHLFKEIPDYEKILRDPRHYALDENNNTRTLENTVHSTLGRRIKYLGKSFFNLSLFRHSLEETRYRYQWFLKKQVCQLHPPYDMTDLIWRKFAEGNLSVSFHDYLSSDRTYQRAGKKNWKISWKNGKLIGFNNSKEIPAFHFVDLKNRMDDLKIELKNIPDDFNLNSEGFQV